MEDDAGEGDYAACGNFCNEAGVVAKVADFVVAAFFDYVVYPRANTAARIGQEMDGAVFFVHVIQCTPAGEIWFVVGITDVARVLMPREFHAGFRAFDDVLFPEEVRVVAEGGPAYFGHEVAEEEGAEFGLLAEAVGDEVAFVAVVDADGVRALLIHARVHSVDEGLAFVAQELEVVFWNDGFEDEIAFVFILLFLRLGDGHGQPDLQDIADTRPFAPDVCVRVFADFVGVFVLEAGDGGEAHVGRCVETGSVNDLVMCDDEVARVAGDHYGVFGQVGPGHAVGEYFVAVFCEIVGKEAMGLGPDGEVAAVGFGYIDEIDDGKGGE